jgi:hypothetical protein
MVLQMESIDFLVVVYSYEFREAILELVFVKWIILKIFKWLHIEENFEAS